jgi:hypothetical protein
MMSHHKPGRVFMTHRVLATAIDCCTRNILGWLLSCTGVTATEETAPKKALQDRTSRWAMCRPLHTPRESPTVCRNQWAIALRGAEAGEVGVRPMNLNIMCQEASRK